MTPLGQVWTCDGRRYRVVRHSATEVHVAPIWPGAPTLSIPLALEDLLARFTLETPDAA